MAASIIVNPPHLTFNSSEADQTFEIFNVNQYPVKYVVKATAPEKYIISNTEGTLKPQCKVSITVTHVDMCVTNENVYDRFRIYFSSSVKHKKPEPIGHRDITAVLAPQKKTPQSPTRGGGEGRTRTHSAGADPHSFYPSSPSSPSTRIRHSSTPSTHSSRSLVRRPSEPEPEVPSTPPPPEGLHGHYLLAYLLPMVIGAVLLWLPTRDTVPGTPWYLELSEVTKNTVCFFLGVLVTLFYKSVTQAER